MLHKTYCPPVDAHWPFTKKAWEQTIPMWQPPSTIWQSSSFAITLMVQDPESGGVFEYVKDVRNADRGEMMMSDSFRKWLKS
jgi:hypothetical protein